MRLLPVAVVFAADLALGVAAHAAPPVYSTGVDDSGNLLPVGAVDPHYVITSVPTKSLSAHASSLHPSWVANTSSSQWINPTGDGMVFFDVGTYTYEMKFDLTGYNADTLAVTGSWASDNASRIYLNGIDTGFVSPSGPNNELGKMSSFALSDGFKDGMNTLRFDVVNTGFQSGLHVHITNIAADLVPEPGSAAILATVAGSTLLSRRRRSR
jgi:hypothetical protein